VDAEMEFEDEEEDEDTAMQDEVRVSLLARRIQNIYGLSCFFTRSFPFNGSLCSTDIKTLLTALPQNNDKHFP